MFGYRGSFIMLLDSLRAKDHEVWKEYTPPNRSHGFTVVRNDDRLPYVEGCSYLLHEKARMCVGPYPDDVMDYVWYLVWQLRESNTVRIFERITSILG
ncbi:hypothetical protein Goe24_00160 [Bacillus phage vB_BsuM-Goe24]|uniref:Uncharacterized protein n=1 Tax=Bacillus phage vB_BsuM-Goe3 TaxID=1933063 RepID=A0A217EQY6_BPGO3|nr:hypothetical protein HWB07_gp015 [Bacillus phage vB_BsuM-Goe3]APZ82481.1 hypothetical protein Goe3_c01500 [Bacillus phage vB_BsuM-Goe3]WCS69396.1 hypothetical protein Goe24_00160 [Bacillus phage vB_BsuM-Goe24]